VCRVSDVDECQQGSHECTGALMHCVNRPGTYICQCSDGFQMNHALVIYIFIFIIESYTKYRNTYRVHAHIHKDKTDHRND